MNYELEITFFIFQSYEKSLGLRAFFVQKIILMMGNNVEIIEKNVCAHRFWTNGA